MGKIPNNLCRYYVFDEVQLSPLLLKEWLHWKWLPAKEDSVDGGKTGECTWVSW